MYCSLCRAGAPASLTTRCPGRAEPSPSSSLAGVYAWGPRAAYAWPPPIISLLPWPSMNHEGVGGGAIWRAVSLSGAQRPRDPAPTSCPCRFLNGGMLDRMLHTLLLGAARLTLRFVTEEGAVTAAEAVAMVRQLRTHEPTAGLGACLWS